MNFFIFLILDIFCSIVIVWIFNIIEQKRKKQKEEEVVNSKSNVFTIDDLHKKMEERKKKGDVKDE